MFKKRLKISYTSDIRYSERQEIQEIQIPVFDNSSRKYDYDFAHAENIFFLCPRHSKNGGGALSVTPVRASVRPSVIKSWCPLNNFWKTASIPFIFGVLIYYIKKQVEFDSGYNLLIFDGVIGLL